MGNLTRKGKPKLKVGNHAHKSMLSNPAIVRRAEMEHIGNALETEAKIETISYIDTAIQNLMEIANQKSTLDAHTKQ